MEKMNQIEKERAKMEKKLGQNKGLNNLKLDSLSGSGLKLDTPEFQSPKYKNVNTDMRNYVDKLETEIQSLTEEKNDLNDRLHNLQEQLEESKYAESTYKKKERNLKDMLSSNSAEKAKSSLVNRDMNHRIDTLLQDIDELRENLHQEKTLARQFEI
jgi:chromosome segregation ATPase